MNYLLAFFLFVPLSVLSFTTPGLYLLKKTGYNLSPLEGFTIGTALGFVLFTLTSYFATIINLQIAIPFLVLLINVFEFRKLTLKNLHSLSHSLSIKHTFLLLLFIFGVIGQMLIISPSGTTIDGNIYFYSAHGHDAPWHMALMNEIKKGWPLQNPVFAREKLVNYHFFSDVAPAIFSKYTNLSDLDLYFRLFPLLYSILLGLTAYVLTKKFTSSSKAGAWAVFFTYFAGSFGYIVTFLRDKSIGGESIFWATQIQSASGNPPQIVSDFILLSVLALFLLYCKKRSNYAFAILCLLISSLALFKIYAAIVLLGPILTIGLWNLLRKRGLHILLLGALAAALAMALYLPNVSGTSFLIFEPWWYIRTMIVEPSRLNCLDCELRRQTYLYEHNYKRVIYLEAVGFIIFFFGNLGTRFIGLLTLPSFVRKMLHDNFRMLTVGIMVLSVLFPLLFLQKGVATNTSQSLQYFILLMGILAGVSWANLLGKIRPRALRSILSLLLILFSIPTQLGLLQEFYSRKPYSVITKAEGDALEFAKNTLPNDSIILTPPYDQYRNLGDEVPKIWDWYDTSYVAAFSNRRVYFDDQEQVDIMGYDFKERLENKKSVFLSEDIKEVEKALSDAQIQAIYFPKLIAPKVSLETLGFMKIYENTEVEIWVISR